MRLKIFNYLKRSFTPKKTKKEYLDYDHHLFTNQLDHCKRYDIGDFTYGSPNIFDVSNYDDVATMPTKLKIGKFCSLGPNLLIILGSEHRSDWISTYPFNALNNKFRYIKGHPSTKGDITIENDVWIGANVTILSGVKIGNGAIIGANSLVSKDVLPYSIFSGNPAKFIKFRFDAEVIKRLEEISWWDLPIEDIEQKIELLQSDKIAEFLNIK